MTEDKMIGRAPQLEETPETPPSSRAEGLLFLHGLESNPENSMDRGAWRAIVHGIAKSWTRLSGHAVAAANCSFLSFLKAKTVLSVPNTVVWD